MPEVLSSAVVKGGIWENGSFATGFTKIRTLPFGQKPLWTSSEPWREHLFKQFSTFSHFTHCLSWTGPVVTALQRCMSTQQQPHLTVVVILCSLYLIQVLSAFAMFWYCLAQHTWYIQLLIPFLPLCSTVIYSTRAFGYQFYLLNITQSSTALRSQPLAELAVTVVAILAIHSVSPLLPAVFSHTAGSPCPTPQLNEGSKPLFCLGWSPGWEKQRCLCQCGRLFVTCPIRAQTNSKLQPWQGAESAPLTPIWPQ